MRFKKGIALVMAFSFLGLFGGCSKNKTGESENNISSVTNPESSSQENNSQESNSQESGFLMDNLLDSADFLGKTADEIGIPEELIKKTAFDERVYIDGDFLGAQEYGTLQFDENKKADSIWLHIGKSDFESVRTALVGKFGEPTCEGEEPYVEVNGGAVLWSEFETDLLKIRLSNGSARNYSEIDISCKN